VIKVIYFEQDLSNGVLVSELKIEYYD
jgi:hypothetical protein